MHEGHATLTVRSRARRTNRATTPIPPTGCARFVFVPIEEVPAMTDKTKRVDDPAVFVEVAKEQPGTWPTSAADLAAGGPAAGDAVSEPTGDFAYIPDPGAGDDAQRRAQPREGTTPVPSFTASFSVGERGTLRVFEATVAGPATFVERMTRAFAEAFFAETNPTR